MLVFGAGRRVSSHRDQEDVPMTSTHPLPEIDAARRTRQTGRPTSEDLEMIERTRGARDLLSSKWKVDLLYLLARGVRRYSRLYDNLRGASKKMLTDSLRSLERDGFVERHVFAEVPVRVEYSLTTLGWSATELLIALADWADEHMCAVEEARTRYDEVGRGAPLAAVA
jgi:DNA-binding HxlR family transcriptional regulator